MVEEQKDIPGGYICNIGSLIQGGDYSLIFNRNRQCPVAVLPPAPFNIEIEKPKVGFARNSELGLKIKVTRKVGFDQALYIDSYWEPGGVGRQPPVIIERDQDEAVFKLTASNSAVPGTYRYSLIAREYKGGDARDGSNFHYVSSAPVDLKVIDPYLELTLPRSSIERGKQGELAATIKSIRPFPGKAKLKLVRLPFGVKQLSVPEF